MSILVLGTLAIDTIKTPEKLRKNILGGSAAHFSMAARLFTDVHLSAVVGDDFPKQYIDFLEKKGIILTSLIKTRGRSFRWECEYKKDFNTAITVKTQLGVLPMFKPQVSENQRAIGYLFLANTDPDMQRHLLRRMRSVRLAALDSMNYWIENKRKSLLRLLRKVDVYLANESEARQLSGEYNLARAAGVLRKMGPQMIIIKKGEHGVLFYCDRFICSLPCYPVKKVIDPTGAGDTFAGGFMGYLAKRGRIKDNFIRRAVAYGATCASFTVEGFGVDKTKTLSLNKLNQRLCEFKKTVNF